MELYVGTYTENLAHVDGKATGVYVADYDETDGSLNQLREAAALRNPSWLTSRANSVYAVIETVDFDGGTGGGVAALKLDKAGGPLAELANRPSGGIEPAHLEVDPTGRWLVVSNYRNGSLTTFPILDGGSIGDQADRIQHEGSSVNPDRQSGPHAHQVVFGGENNRVFVPDLGTDCIKVYSLNSRTGHLNEVPAETIECRPGSGPRHMVLHDDGMHAFVVNELDNTVSAFSNAEHGAFREVAVVSTLPTTFSDHSQAAAIRLGAGGSVLYASNRGHDSIAIIDFAPQAQTLEFRDAASTEGLEPRDFVLAPDGRFLLAANQDSDTITSFAVDPQGGLTFTGNRFDVFTPVCLLFK